MPPAARVPLLILGFIGLFAGVGAGLARLAWVMPDLLAQAAGVHGALMICGFFGVVISLERAVAVGRTWTYVGPLLAGLGTIAAVQGAGTGAAVFYGAASAVLLVASLDIVRRQPALFTVTIAIGAASWCVGNLLWATGAVAPLVVPWWLAFLIITIAGERLELARFMPPSAAAQRMFAGLLVLIVAGLAGTSQRWGAPLLGLALLGLAAWLFRYDIARRTVRQKGLTRFIAVCLLSGYVWLAVGAAVMLAAGGLVPGTAAYDATVHALGMGFVFSMVFGHAPIIFPAVLRVTMRYHASFYLPLALLHAALLLRLAGDATGQGSWVRWGGMASALALAAFIVSTVTAVVRGWQSAGRLAHGGPP